MGWFFDDEDEKPQKRTKGRAYMKQAKPVKKKKKQAQSKAPSGMKYVSFLVRDAPRNKKQQKPRAKAPSYKASQRKKTSKREPESSSDEDE